MYAQRDCITGSPLSVSLLNIRPLYPQKAMGDSLQSPPDLVSAATRPRLWEEGKSNLRRLGRYTKAFLKDHAVDFLCISLVLSVAGVVCPTTSSLSKICS